MVEIKFYWEKITSGGGSEQKLLAVRSLAVRTMKIRALTAGAREEASFCRKASHQSLGVRKNEQGQRPTEGEIPKIDISNGR